MNACGDGTTPADGGSDATVRTCDDHAQCDDGIFCNGLETCAPGEPGTSPLGCRAGAAPCEATQVCDESARGCSSICGMRTDADGDGVDAVECGGTDCDDADAQRFPGALERCNAADDDCDGRVDEEMACADGGVDAGSDAGAGPDAGAGDDAGSDAGTDASAPGAAMCEACALHSDCADGFCVSLAVGGRACVRSCEPDLPSCPRGFACVLDIASGVDTTLCLPLGRPCCVDDDRDGYGTGLGCPGYDCDDGDPNVHPHAPELCDTTDQDCDGIVDEGPTPCATGFCRFHEGAFELVHGGACVSGGCSGGTATSCDQFVCQGDGAGASCATSCGLDDDALCIASARCDAGTCLPRLANGSACDEDRDCLSAHCNNGLCCGSGTCCMTADDCPRDGDGVVCNDPVMCQGRRSLTTCESFRCNVVTGIDDDSACDESTLARACDPYVPVYCTGERSQPAPRCPTSCTDDDDCVELAHCASGVCTGDG